jgi:hypothetical protein
MACTDRLIDHELRKPVRSEKHALLMRSSACYDRVLPEASDAS